jgi:hypothetical protein
MNHETDVCLTLQTSTSFFTVQRSPVKLAQTLGASCGVNFDNCSTLMASLARQMQSPDNCAADLQNQNPTVMQAYTGFVAYPSLYHAGCLLNDDTGGYCKFSSSHSHYEHVLTDYRRLLRCSHERNITHRQLCLLSTSRRLFTWHHITQLLELPARYHVCLCECSYQSITASLQGLYHCSSYD